jgi:hypothetical protein
MRATRALPVLAFLVLAIVAVSPRLIPTAHAAGNPNGVAGSMPAYYDHRLFTINFKEFTASEATLLAKNGQTNVIWQSDPGLPGGQPFISVIDAIPGDGMNPLWAEVQITFNAGHTPRQLFSDNEIAAARNAGEIHCTPTGELYRCSVIGPPPPAASAFPTGHASLSLATPGAIAAGAPAGSTWGRLKRMYR